MPEILVCQQRLARRRFRARALRLALLLLFALVAGLLGRLDRAKAHGLLQWLGKWRQAQRFPRRRVRLWEWLGREWELLARQLGHLRPPA